MKRLSEKLFDALQEMRGYPIHTKRKRKDGTYEKIGPGIWKKISPETKIKEMESEAQKLKELIDKGVFKKGMSLEDHKKLAEKVRKDHEPRIKPLLNELQEIAGSDAIVQGRIKTPDSILGKLVRKPENYSSANDLDDTTGTRIIHKTIQDVMKSVEKVKKKYEIVEEEDKINNPDGDYRSYHMTIKDKDGLNKELQIRTEGQDDFANWSHNIYKPLTTSQKKMLKNPDVKKKIENYSTKMSEHIFKKESGVKIGKPPPCPHEIKRIFGCL